MYLRKCTLIDKETINFLTQSFYFYRMKTNKKVNINNYIKPSNMEISYEISAAIDFGTTYSGVAYSYAGDKNKVYASNKVPTAILFDSNERFLAFGQEAVDKFVDLAEEDEEKEVYYFHRFKMQLYSEKGVTKALELRDASGKSMKALKVFSEAISHLTQEMKDSINKRYPTVVLSETSIQWVLTVPAIWDDSAKQFMREAAEMSGLGKRHLKIALEPECASLYCFNAGKEHMVSTTTFSRINSKYLVLDNGGGTVDVTAHQINDDSSVKEIYKASGGAWGGTKVDELFIEYLYTLFTKANVEEVRKECPSEWEQFIKDFELKKREVRTKPGQDTVSLIIPVQFKKVHFRRLPESVTKGAIFKASRLKIPKIVIAEMISKVATKIINHVNDLVQNLNGNIDFIVMVGGFSNSPLVVSDVKTFVANQKNIPVIVPEEADLSVVKGAALFGWDQKFVSIRKARKTYGFRISNLFKDGVDPKDKMFVDDFGEKRCRSYFDSLVKVNQELEINKTIERTYSNPQKNSTCLSLPLFSTETGHVTYTDEDGVVEVGTLYVPMPVISDLERKVDVVIIFGDTEIKVKARDRTTGKEVEGTYDFL